MKKPKVVLPADVFDALELSALVNGGIGAGCLAENVVTKQATAWDDDDETIEVPSCIVGHALFLDGYEMFSESVIDPGNSPVCDALVEAFPGLVDDIEAAKDYQEVTCALESRNDNVVSNAPTYITRKQNREPTVTWKQWCKLMHVVRGEK